MRGSTQWRGRRAPASSGAPWLSSAATSMARSAGRGRRAARAQGKKQGLWVAGLLALVAWGLVLMLWALMVVMLG
jgi:hypothetical protein